MGLLEIHDPGKTKHVTKSAVVVVVSLKTELTNDLLQLLLLLLLPEFLE